MKIDELTIGEAKELANLFGRSETKKIDGGIRIVVLQRGWVVVGRFSQVGHDCRLDDSAVVRIWGTSKGLPEIVKGPIEGKTVLDKSPLPILFNELTIVFMLQCEEKEWSKKLS